MTCNPELVSAFLDGELDQIIADTVTTHLLKCDSCCHTLSELAQIRDAVREQCVLPDPEKAILSVMSAISNEKTFTQGEGSKLLGGLARMGRRLSLEAK